VAREDLADVAATVLNDPNRHRGKVYELVGERAINGMDIANSVAMATGGDIQYVPGTLSELRRSLTSAGVPDWQIPVVVSTYSNIANGFLAGTDGDLVELLTKSPRSPLDVIISAVEDSASSPAP
jgi:NAD(P)H dehydrogenase (quinone)